MNMIGNTYRILSPLAETRVYETEEVIETVGIRVLMPSGEELIVKNNVFPKGYVQRFFPIYTRLSSPEGKEARETGRYTIQITGWEPMDPPVAAD